MWTDLTQADGWTDCDAARVVKVTTLEQIKMQVSHRLHRTLWHRAVADSPLVAAHAGRFRCVEGPSLPPHRPTGEPWGQVAE